MHKISVFPDAQYERISESILSVSYIINNVVFFLQEYWLDNQGRRRPGRRGINLTAAQYHRLQTVMGGSIDEDARLLLNENESSDNSRSFPVLRRIPTVCDLRQGVAAPSTGKRPASAASDDVRNKLACTWEIEV